jgi:hypothetical protein
LTKEEIVMRAQSVPWTMFAAWRPIHSASLYGSKVIVTRFTMRAIFRIPDSDTIDHLSVRFTPPLIRYSLIVLLGVLTYVLLFEERVNFEGHEARWTERLGMLAGAFVIVALMTFYSGLARARFILDVERLFELKRVDQGQH